MQTIEKPRRGHPAIGAWGWFHAERQRLGLTTAQVAEALGVGYTAVSQWERKEHRPSWAHHQKIADLFNVPVTTVHQELSRW